MNGIHICRGTNTKFQGRVRMAGHRRYVLVGKPSKSSRVAIMAMAQKVAAGNWKRGDVIMWADYYDPLVIVEMVRP